MGKKVKRVGYSTKKRKSNRRGNLKSGAENNNLVGNRRYYDFDEDYFEHDYGDDYFEDDYEDAYYEDEYYEDDYYEDDYFEDNYVDDYYLDVISLYNYNTIDYQNNYDSLDSKADNFFRKYPWVILILAVIFIPINFWFWGSDGGNQFKNKDMNKERSSYNVKEQLKEEIWYPFYVK